MPAVQGLEGAEFVFAGDEHGRILLDGAGRDVRVGDRISLIPSHCDTTINLHDVYWVVRDGRLEDVWPIAARGCIRRAGAPARRRPMPGVLPELDPAPLDPAECHGNDVPKATPGRGRGPQGPAKRQPPKDRYAHLSEQERAALKELAEVERAIAILEGRSDANPEDVAFARQEAERIRRHLDEALAKTEQRVRDLRRAKLLRAALAVLALAALAALLAVLVPLVTGELAGRAKASEVAKAAAEPFARAGFEPLESGSGPEALVVPAERGRCYVAVAGAADGTGRVRVEREHVTVEGRSAGFCGCRGESVRVTPLGPAPIDVRVLVAPAAVAGGADLLGILPAPPEARVPESIDRGCAEEGIDAYVAAHLPAAWAPAPDGAPPGGAPPGGADDARLAAVGLRPAGVAAPGHPWVILPIAKGMCFHASSDAEADTLVLRLRGGERPLRGERAPLAFCGDSLAGASVWREGTGTLRVYATPAERVGGLLGLGELAERIGRPAVAWAPRVDLAFDARAALAGSGLGPLRPGDSLTDPGSPLFASFLAVSTDPSSLFAVDPRNPDALCRPPVQVGVTRAICMQTRPDALGDAKSLPPGSAVAKRPLWLPVARGNRAQNEMVLGVLAFTRRLSAEGFERTTLTGYTEVPGGVEVTGRSGEREIVAVTLSTGPPYLHLLTDGPDWRPDGDIRVVPLPAGKTVKLSARPPFVGPKSARETIVWRR